MKRTLFILLAIMVVTTGYSQGEKAKVYPSIFVTAKDKADLINKLQTEAWAKASWENLKEDIDPYVNRHVSDPEWIVSRLSMYWKEGEHYTQCYVKKQNWDYGVGNAPVPTVRLPGMRIWNDYNMVPLEDRIPYNESGDMWGVSRSSGDPTPVLIPYKKTGHLVRRNNTEILDLAEKAAFAYFVTEDEKYAKFASDILWTWLLGTYYMEPPLDPTESTGGPGGYEPGGIMGYYDYEVIHDDTQIPAASAYDFLHDYMLEHPNKKAQELDKNITEIAGTVFKRFIDIGLIRGGKKGNWNVNRYKNLISSMLVLEPDSYYADEKGREYYIPYYLEIETRQLNPLPNIMAYYDPITGLWPESPGYASGMIPTVLEMGLKLYHNGINTFKGFPMIKKAAMANLAWLDARGNLVVFGDMRGGPSNISAFESLLSYYSAEGDTENAAKVSAVIRKALESGQYKRNKFDVEGLCLYQKLEGESSDLPYYDAVYSRFHRHIIMKNKNDEDNGLMFTLYGGRKGSHLSDNGLAMQFYGHGYAMAPDASAYESYWTPDMSYHSGATGSNTIIPGYTRGEITLNAMDPMVAEDALHNEVTTSSSCSFADVSADEKRRLVAMVRTSETSGYYVDIFRSDLESNDYIHHNLGDKAELETANGKNVKLVATNDLGTEYNKAYSYFSNQRKTNMDDDFIAHWTIDKVSPKLCTDMWMMGQNSRELYLVDAPPTTLRGDLTPGEVNRAPQGTPTLIVRQNKNNAKESPFVAVFETYDEGEKAIKNITKIKTSDTFVAIKVDNKNGSSQYILNAIDDQLYTPEKGLEFKGTFAIASADKSGFQYLYLGKGKSVSFDGFKLEAAGASLTAELRMKDGALYYSADAPLIIQINNGEPKKYPSGYDVLLD